MKLRTRDQLIEFVEQGNEAQYLFFWGHRQKSSEVTKSCFSQWYSCSFEHEGHKFHSAEHYMMFQKAMLFGDKTSAEKVLLASNPAEAKAIGRKVNGFEQAVWAEKSFDIVVNGNMAKFCQNPALGDFLVSTASDVLVEASPVDPIWGIGLAQDDPAAENPIAWKGHNLLGFALMEVRERLINLKDA